MQKDACYQLGSFIKTHGIKGELQIFLDVDEPEDYQNLDSIFVEINQKLVPYFIKSLQIQGEKGLVKLEEVDSLEAAQKLLNCSLYLPLYNLPSLPKHQFYYHEIIGFHIFDLVQGKLGIVTNIYESANQDLIAMLFKGKEILIPIVDEIVLEVNREEKELKVNLPVGLLEIYLEE